MLTPLLSEIDIVIAPAASYSTVPAVPWRPGPPRVEERFRAAVIVATLGQDGSVARCRGELFGHQPPRCRSSIRPAPGTPFVGVSPPDGCKWERGAGGALLTYANRVAGLNCRAVGPQTALPGRGPRSSV